MSKIRKIISTILTLVVFFFITGIISYYEAPGFIILILALALVFILRGIWKKDKKEDTTSEIKKH